MTERAEQPPKDSAPLLMMTELLFEQPPDLDPRAVEARIKSRLPATRLVSETASHTLLFAHEDHVITYQGGEGVPAQFAVMLPSEPHLPQQVTPAVQQTWNWPAARELAPRLGHAVLAVELMARLLDYRDRFRLFSTSLLGLIEATRPAAVHCQHAQMLVDPATILRASGDADPMAMLRCHLNVRFFNIEGSGGDMLMDTRGLAALGLPDVQMNFRSGLEPGRVAGFLFNVGQYLFQSGDVIQDGETVEGFPPGQRWRCQHEMAMVGPERVVLDVNPGAPHAAGTRG